MGCVIDMRNISMVMQNLNNQRSWQFSTCNILPGYVNPMWDLRLMCIWRKWENWQKRREKRGKRLLKMEIASGQLMMKTTLVKSQCRRARGRSLIRRLRKTNGRPSTKRRLTISAVTMMDAIILAQRNVLFSCVGNVARPSLRMNLWYVRHTRSMWEKSRKIFKQALSVPDNLCLKIFFLVHC